MDIAQNSIKAEASLVEIKVCEDTASSLLTIVIADNGKEMREILGEDVPLRAPEVGTFIYDYLASKN
ncbi:MAG: hypothetical protein KBS66_03595 [Eubacterium sp.]|nr:hypothetical protein [Candidatus Colimonas fimequi]